MGKMEFLSGLGTFLMVIGWVTFLYMVLWGGRKSVWGSFRFNSWLGIAGGFLIVGIVINSVLYFSSESISTSRIPVATGPDTIVSIYSGDSSVRVSVVMGRARRLIEVDRIFDQRRTDRYVVYVCEQDHHMHSSGIPTLSSGRGSYFVCPACGGGMVYMEFTDMWLPDTNDVYYQPPIFINLEDTDYEQR